MAPEESKKYAHEIGKEFIRIQDEISITELKEGIHLSKNSKNITINYTDSKNYFAINWIGLDKTQYYIRLGYFLEFLQLNIIPSINSDTNVRLLKIDYILFSFTNLVNLTYLPDAPWLKIINEAFWSVENKCFEYFPGVICFDGNLLFVIGSLIYPFHHAGLDVKYSLFSPVL